jgi:hypothetical protein
MSQAVHRSAPRPCIFNERIKKEGKLKSNRKGRQSSCVHPSPAHRPTWAAVIVATLVRPPAPRCAVAALARRLEDLRPMSSHNHDAGLVREACDDLATTMPQFVSFASPSRGPSPAHHPTRAAVIVTTLARPLRRARPSPSPGGLAPDVQPQLRRRLGHLTSMAICLSCTRRLPHNLLLGHTVHRTRQVTGK